MIIVVIMEEHFSNVVVVGCEVVGSKMVENWVDYDIMFFCSLKKNCVMLRAFGRNFFQNLSHTCYSF